jgi:radical SAM superfamily enzyme YgiQ (UPF0313 family)
LRLAKEAGCCGLFIGIETVSDKNLASMNKGFNDSRGYAEKIAAIRKHGIGIIAGMIVGMDDDDTGVFERTLRFLQETKIEALQLNILTPLPGTPLYEDFKKQDRIIDNDWSHYDFRHAVIQPKKMSVKELQEGADWLYREFYRLDRIILRSIRSLVTLGWLPGLLAFRLNMTYRYDNKREGVRGRNPAPLEEKKQLQRQPKNTAMATLCKS